MYAISQNLKTNGESLVLSFLLIIGVQLSVAKVSTVEIFEKPEADRPRLMERIVNGSRASVGQFPHQVSLRYSWNGAHFCGGSIVDARWIVTAAHCMYLQTGAQIKPWMITVVAGDIWLNQTSVTGQSRVTNRIIVHENYDYVTYENDIALLKLSSPMRFDGPAVRYQVLQNRDLPAGTMCEISGWGYPAEDILLLVNELTYVAVPIVSRKLCRELYADFTDLPEGMMCAGYVEGMKDACQGDSGGGLVCEGVLTGIVSSGNGCASPGYPGIYTNVRHYRSWILRSSSIADRNCAGYGNTGLSPWAGSLSVLIIWTIGKSR